MSHVIARAWERLTDAFWAWVDDSPTREAFALTGIGLAIVVCLWCSYSWFEARAFERVTGQRVDVLDAMFVTLRVDGAPMEEK